MIRISHLAAAIGASVVTFAVGAPAPTLGQTALGPVARSPFNPPDRDDAPPPMPLVADGYCVVTLRDRQQWQLGHRDLGGVFDGREYRFASPRERAIFAAAPEKYAPVLGGDCIVTLAQSGQRTPGRIEHGVLRGGRLYFMASEERLRDFTADPARYLDADLADGGRCPVTLHDQRRNVAGIPATVATYGGLRYYFASARHRAMFLTNPGRFAPGSSTDYGAASSHPSATGDPQAVVQRNETEEGADSDNLSLEAQPLMGGYCPVTIRQTGAWVRGRYDYRVEFGPLIFVTVGPAEQDALEHDPAHFLPAIGGDCVATLVDDGHRVRGSIFHAAEYQGRLYLFADAHRKAAFKADPMRYALIDVAAAGACVVTQKQAGRNVPGDPKFATWRRGLVYRFAGAAELQQFLASPETYEVELPELLRETADAAAARESPSAEPTPQSAVAQ